MCIRIHKQQIKRRNKYKKERKEKNCSKDNAKLYDTFDEIYKYACRMNKKKEQENCYPYCACGAHTYEYITCIWISG